jgi:aminopeptidase-like protein
MSHEDLQVWVNAAIESGEGDFGKGVIAPETQQKLLLSSYLIDSSTAVV